MKRKSILILPALLMIMIAGQSPFFRGGAEAQEAASDIFIYEFPEIENHYSLKGGYRLFDLDGSERSFEYGYPKSGLSLGGEYIAFPFPHRVHLSLDAESPKDYLGDASYAYKDTVLFRATARRLYHSLDNFELVDLNPLTSSPGVQRFDETKDYAIKSGASSLFLRLKTPDFPFHVFLDGRFVNKDGARQERFLGGSGWFNDVRRGSESRSVDWDTSDISIGANSHLGPVELEYSHNEKRFDAGGDRVMEYDYAGAGFPAGSIRPEGTYPYGLVPDSKGSADTLKLHTSYTGQIVASTTFMWNDRENTVSGARADYFIGAGEITWMPVTRLVASLRYRHKETDMETPETLPAGYLGYSSYASEVANIRPAISSEVDTLTGNVKYIVAKGVSVGLKYTYKETDRTDAEKWGIEDGTTENTVAISTNMRLPMALKLKATYKHREVDDPANNRMPNRSDSGLVSFSWSKLKRVTAFMSYYISDEERNDLSFGGLLPTTEAGGRDADKNRFTGGVTVLAMEDLSFDASYSCWRNKIRQDLVYNSSTVPYEFVDPDVLYEDKARNYAANVNYAPKDNIALSAGINHTKSEGGFDPNIREALSPVSIASYSDVKLRETVYSIRGEYGLKEGWGLGLKYLVSDFENLLENPDNPEVSDGTAQAVLLTISKRW